MMREFLKPRYNVLDVVYVVIFVRLFADGYYWGAAALVVGWTLASVVLEQKFGIKNG